MKAKYEQFVEDHGVAILTVVAVVALIGVFT